MQTLIKWPGGKSREIKNVHHLIPDFERYIEPFFGGGAVYFHLNPQRAVINDISSDLTNFYKCIKSNNQRLKERLERFNYYWSEAYKDYIDTLYPNLYDTYIDCRQGRKSCLHVEEAVGEIVSNSFCHIKAFEEQFIVDYEGFFNEIIRNLVFKLKRMQQLEIKNQALLSKNDIKVNIETGLRGAFYMHVRNLYNDIILEKKKCKHLSLEDKVAIFYFIREYCYGAMFRYNAKGEFNIPYGGISYNKKDFGKKIGQLFSQKTMQRFRNTDIHCEDFEGFLGRIDANEKDFIFLDPPYDSDFSDYEGNKFTLEDQKRLASCLQFTASSFILIIKDTDFIFNLYKSFKNVSVLRFDKQYTYNVRSRNDRTATHLLITNIKS